MVENSRLTQLETSKNTDQQKQKDMGGEGIAWHAHINISPIDPVIIGQIAEITQNPLCFSACVLRLVSFSVLIVTMYLFDGEGLSNRN